MKKLLLALLIILSFGAQATELNYNWTPGAYYHFTATSNDQITTSMMGMNMREEFNTVSDFVLQINSVDQNGTASGILYLINFKIKTASGATLATLSDIPKEAIQSEVSVDRKGVFTFPKKVYLIAGANSNILAYGNADENSASVGGQAGNMKVDAYAEFDPNTGQLKSGYSVKTIKNTTQVSVKLDGETQMIDVLPYSFLELLILPEGDVLVNDHVTMQAGIYNTEIHVNSMESNVATINHKISTNKSQDMFDGNASGTRGDGSAMFNMGMDMEIVDEEEFDGMDDFDNMDDFDDLDDMDEMSMENMATDMTIPMSQEDQMAMDMSKGMAPDMNGDITSEFNFAQGMFKEVKGIIATRINTMGMKMETTTRLTMVLNK